MLDMSEREHVKILFLCDGLGGGGKEHRLVQLIKGLNDSRYGELYLIMTRNYVAYREVEKYNIKITYINRFQWNFIFKYLNFINQLQPDIIQIWSEAPLFYFNIIRPLIIYKCPVSFSSAADCNFHLKPFVKRIFYLFSYRWLHSIVGNSMAGLNNYRVPKSKQYCIYNGFDSSRLNKDLNRDIRKELNIRKKYVVAMIARFTEAKDWKMFVDAACLILKKRDDVFFLAVGDGETRMDIEQYLQGDFKDRFLFLGRRNDIESILRGTDVSTLCSNPQEHAEGVSNSIVESCAFGVPVIATRGGGTSEILKNGENGYIIEPHSTDELSLKINFLLDNDTIRYEMGIKAKSVYESKFSLSKATIQYMQLFETMLTPLTVKTCQKKNKVHVVF